MISPDPSPINERSRSALHVPHDIPAGIFTEYRPYVKLTRPFWTELSDLALINEAHLETAPEKPLVFVTSDDPVQHDFDRTNVTNIRMFDLRSEYRNTVRLRWTRYREYPRTLLLPNTSLLRDLSYSSDSWKGFFLKTNLGNGIRNARTESRYAGIPGPRDLDMGSVHFNRHVRLYPCVGFFQRRKTVINWQKIFEDKDSYNKARYWVGIRML